MANSFDYADYNMNNITLCVLLYIAENCKENK